MFESVLVGLCGTETKSHLCRAVLESIGYQSMEILEIMRKESKTDISVLNVDGGMTNSKVFLQIQSDILGTKICKPNFGESTVLGAAFAAGLHLGIYSFDGENNHCTTFEPKINEIQRSANMARWEKAVDCACLFTV